LAPIWESVADEAKRIEELMAEKYNLPIEVIRRVKDREESIKRYRDRTIIDIGPPGSFWDRSLMGKTFLIGHPSVQVRAFRCIGVGTIEAPTGSEN
jgi:hypothetical protein